MEKKGRQEKRICERWRETIRFNIRSQNWENWLYFEIECKFMLRKCVSFEVWAAHTLDGNSSVWTEWSNKHVDKSVTYMKSTSKQFSLWHEMQNHNKNRRIQFKTIIQKCNLPIHERVMDRNDSSCCYLLVAL